MSTPTTPKAQAVKGDTIPSYWEYPSPLGLGASRDLMTGGAAPLLAGFSIALIGVIAQAPQSMRWPGTALLLYSLSAALLTTCVQFGFWARAYIYSAQDVSAWFPDFDSKSWQKEHMQKLQRGHFDRWRAWHKRARLMYDLGIVCLAAAVALTVAPPSSYGDHEISTTETVLRWVAAGIIGCAAIAEIVWIFLTVREGRKLKE